IPTAESRTLFGALSSKVNLPFTTRGAEQAVHRPFGGRAVETRSISTAAASVSGLLSPCRQRRLFRPLPWNFQVVERRIPRHSFSVLQLSHDDAGRYIYLL